MMQATILRHLAGNPHPASGSTGWRGFLAAATILVLMAGHAPQVLANCAIVSGNPERTTDASLVDNLNGTTTHTTTGLMWKTCPEGRTYSAGTCTGSTGSYIWQTALRRAVTDSTAGQTDWRLPSRTELLSIVETGCTLPAINTTRFPNVPASAAFWTSTHAGDTAPDSAFAVRFNHGISFIATKDFLANARLVRAGNTVHDNYRAATPTEPAAFSFTSQIATPGATVSSNIVTMAGLTASRSISIVGGQYRINGGGWTAAGGTIANGNTLQLQLTAPNTVPSSESATVNVNGRTASFLITTGTPPPDTLPDPFTFADQPGVIPSTVIVSAPISVSGITLPTNISITGGEYQINGGAWVSIAGSVNNGDSVAVRHTSSASFSTAVNTTLTIGTSGTVSDIFTSTTGALDATPDAFAFTDQTVVPRSTTRTSNTITVSGINTSVAVGITGGTYSKNAGAYTAVGGTAVNGDTFTVQHSSSAAFNTAINTALTIGGVIDTFTSTTEALDTAPDAFVFTDQAGVALSSLMTSNTITVTGINSAASISITGGNYRINAGAYTAVAGSVNAGDTVTVQHTSSGSFNTAVNTALTIGGVVDTFTSTTLAADTTPDPFAFTDVVGVLRSSVQTSNSITVAGINSPAPISVSGGTYSIGAAAFTAVAGNVSNGNTVRVQHTTSASYTTATNTTLTIGGVSDIYSSTTEAAPGDSIPNVFVFTDQPGVAPSTLTTSNTVTITGIDTASPVSITGGEYSIQGGAWTSAPGSITVNQTIAVRHTSSASFSTPINTVLTIGGVIDTFTSTTAAADTTPNTFTFTDAPSVALSSTQTSNIITVTGINASTPISITGGNYKINAGAYTAVAGNVVVNDQVTVQHTASASYNTATNTVLTIGGVADTYTSTTLHDTTPDAFLFTDTTGVAASSLQTSNIITVTGITGPTPISITGGNYKINAGAYTAVAGSVNLNDQVTVQHTASASANTTVNTLLTIGGVSDTFSSTTVSCGTAVWSAVTFAASSGDKTLNCDTAVRTLTGLCAGTSLTFTRSFSGSATIARTTYSINGATGPFGTTASTTVGPTNSIQMRFTQENKTPATYTGTINIGGVAKTWTHTTDSSGNACTPPP